MAPGSADSPALATSGPCIAGSSVRKRSSEAPKLTRRTRALGAAAAATTTPRPARSMATTTATTTTSSSSTTSTPRTTRNCPLDNPTCPTPTNLPRTLLLKPSNTSLRRTSALPQTPRRTPSAPSAPSSILRPPSIIAHPATPTKTDSPLPPGSRSVSIASFPRPPQRNSTNSAKRLSSVPTSPLEASPSPLQSKRTPSSALKRPSTAAMSNRYSNPRDRDSGVAFLSGTSTAGSDALSPPVSRTSSAQDSYSTVATTVDAAAAAAGQDDRRWQDKEQKGNVIISVRVRPDGAEVCTNPDWVVDSRYSRIGYRGRDGGTYEYDNVFGPTDGNARVYEMSAKRLVRRVMEGYHGTVFAYGMTGTGKTFSMQGTTAAPGVIPLAITDIFSYIRETPNREFLLRVSYLEIYNERIHDLLASQPGSSGFVPLDQQTKGEEIKLREDPKRGVYATPLKEEIVQSPTQLLKVIARGDLARRVGSTQFNARSSRSHAVVQIVVESRERIAGATMGADAGRNGDQGVRTSTLSLIDLAGSERAAEDKERRTEGAHINKSLLTLGTVIARLSKDGKDSNGSHLPYRDSKLTRLLQPALSGNSLISILCTIAIPQGTGAAAATNIGETMNTLKFAARAKNNISSNAKKAEETLHMDAHSRALIDRYKAEIAQLRAELEESRRKEMAFLQNQFLQEHETKSSERHDEQIVEISLARTALRDRIDSLSRLIATSQHPAPPTPQRPTSLPLLAQLQHELADKTRYIAQLEQRLLQARRSSLRSSVRVSCSGSPQRASWTDGGGAGMRRLGGERLAVVLREKEDEIAELRRRLEDKERMAAALRKAAEMREVAERGRGGGEGGEEGRRWEEVGRVVEKWKRRSMPEATAGRGLG